MNAAIRGAVILAVIVTVTNAVVILAGMHRSPITGSMLPIALAIVFNLVVVFLVLRSTAPDTNYVGQLRNGLTIGVVGGVLIAIGAWVLLALVFPNALTEMREGSVGFLRAAGLPDEQIQAQLESMEGFTPVNQAIPGLLGTLFTSIFGAVLIGAFQRKR